MNTGLWIFLTAVLLLVVLHHGFRRFAAWAAGKVISAARLIDFSSTHPA
jgi:hypothetical protein